MFVFARSRITAKSGINPIYQNSSDTVKYVETAKTSHISGERNCGHIELEVGSGSSHQPNQTRPTWNSGKMPAHMTAKMVIASAARLTPVRHFCRSKKRIAEISVPAWPIPIHHTKLTIPHPHITGCRTPQTPTPVPTR